MAIDWTPELIETICDRIIAGDSVTAICQSEGMPSTTTFYRKILADAEFDTIIARAREINQHVEVDKFKDIAAKATPETVHVAKLQIWTGMWTASKRAAKHYGDNSTKQITGADGGPVQIESPRTQAEKEEFAAMLAKVQG